MTEQKLMQKVVSRLIEVVRPNPVAVQAEVVEFVRANPGLDRDALASRFANRICRLYTSQGVVSALPGLIPGLGTAAQLVVEGGAVTTDLAFMLRNMAGMCAGIAHIYGRDPMAPFNQDFVCVLGLWCGALQVAKEGLDRITKKVAIAQCKRIPGEIFTRINRKVGTTILTKYGTKRGGIAVGRLIPFGVGAVVGGSFNFMTMKRFKRVAISYYRDGNAAIVES